MKSRENLVRLKRFQVNEKRVRDDLDHVPLIARGVVIRANVDPLESNGAALPRFDLRLVGEPTAP